MKFLGGKCGEGCNARDAVRWTKADRVNQGSRHKRERTSPMPSLQYHIKQRNPVLDPHQTKQYVRSQNL